jgi:thiamine-phosphate pyrophosphorylase
MPKSNHHRPAWVGNPESVMTEMLPPNRCRIVLIAPEGETPAGFVKRFREAIAGGDIASILLPAYGLDEAAFQAFAKPVVAAAQEAGIAAVIAGDTRIAGRVGADGLHLEGDRSAVEEAISHYQSKMMVGVGGAKTRDDALELGEARPDYIFFGRFGYDTKPEPHHRNLTLGQWWAEMVEIPCIVMAGSDIRSVEAVGRTGADFVALSSAVFGEGIDPKEAVARANAILDEIAPRFEE